MQRIPKLSFFLDRYIRSCLIKHSRYLRRGIVNRNKREVIADGKMIEQIAAKQSGLHERAVCEYQIAGIRVEVEGERFCEALSQLPKGQWAVMLLRYWEDMSFIEVANCLRVSRKTIYNWHRAALVTMRKVLNELEGKA